MKFLIVACLVAYAAAECTSLARLKVKSQWAQAYGSAGSSRAALGRLVWDSVYAHVEGAAGVFKDVRGDNVDSPAFMAHSARVLGGLDMCVASLDEPAILSVQLAHLNAQHVSRNVPAAAYPAFVNAVVNAVRATIGVSNFDADSWRACLSEISGGIA